jgi:hypothetical protein
LGAVQWQRARLIAFGALTSLFLARSAFTQDAPAPRPTQPRGHFAVDAGKFVAGGLLGLATHEAGHLLFDVAFDARPQIDPVHLGPVPFFAIAHRGDLSARREFIVSSAGFWVQEATNEWVLTRRPLLREEHAWLTKGLVAFNVLNSVGYALVAIARAGPFERDTRGMADSAGIDERAAGALVLTPAVLDAYRYYAPRSRWAKWTSRAVKAGSVLLVMKGR